MIRKELVSVPVRLKIIFSVELIEEVDVTVYISLPWNTVKMCDDLAIREYSFE